MDGVNVQSSTTQSKSWAYQDLAFRDRMNHLYEPGAPFFFSFFTTSQL